jgi:uncharacterized membrane protein
MTKKTFLNLKIFIAFIIGTTTSISVNYGNWYLPIVLIVPSWVLLYVLRNRVEEVIADERDYMIAGKASVSAVKIYSMLSALAGLVLYIAEKDNIILFTVGNVLLYSTCFLMILYSVLFKIYEKHE